MERRIDIIPDPVGWSVLWRGEVLLVHSAMPEIDAARLLYHEYGMRGPVQVFRNGVFRGVIDVELAVGRRIPGMGGEPRLRATKWVANTLSVACAST